MYNEILLFHNVTSLINTTLFSVYCGPCLSYLIKLYNTYSHAYTILFSPIINFSVINCGYYRSIIILKCLWNEILSNIFLIALARSVKIIIQLLWQNLCDSLVEIFDFIGYANNTTTDVMLYNDIY